MSALPSFLLPTLAPSLREKQRVFAAVRAALAPVVGRSSDRELDEATEVLFRGLAREFGEDFCRRLALPEPVPLALPEAPVRDDPRVRADVEAAILYAEQHGIESVPDALGWFLLHRKKTAEAPCLRECADLFLVALRREGRSPLTLQAHQSRLRAFVRVFGERLPSAVTSDEVLAYLGRWAVMATRATHWDGLSTFYNWMVLQSLALENPVRRAMARPKETEAPRLIYTPEEAERILREVMHSDQIGFWALSLFAGLRTHEIERLDRLADPWRVLDLKRKLIDFEGTNLTVGRRVIYMPEVLQAWLRWVRRKRVRFFPQNHWKKFQVIRAIALAQRYPEDPGVKVGRNGKVRGQRVSAMARRSYMSYRLALEGASYVELTDDVGTSERFLVSKYYCKATAADARKYFGLTPEALGGT